MLYLCTVNQNDSRKDGKRDYKQFFINLFNQQKIMIRYKVFQYKNMNNTFYKKWYARAVCEETIGTAQLAKHMATHSSPFTEGVIKAVLSDAVTCIKELVLDGKNVKLDDLAIFSAGLRTKPADTPEKFNAVENISDVVLRSRATGNLRTAELTREAKLKQFSEYKAGSDAVDEGE